MIAMVPSSLSIYEIPCLQSPVSHSWEWGYIPLYLWLAQPIGQVLCAYTWTLAQTSCQFKPTVLQQPVATFPGLEESSQGSLPSALYLYCYSFFMLQILKKQNEMI